MVSRNLTSPWSGQATTDSLPPIKVFACHSGAALGRLRGQEEADDSNSNLEGES
jgi:hypothetical protein